MHKHLVALFNYHLIKKYLHIDGVMTKRRKRHSQHFTGEVKNDLQVILTCLTQKLLKFITVVNCNRPPPPQYRGVSPYYTYDGLALTAVSTTQYQMQIVAYTSLNLNNSRYKILVLTIGPSVDTA
ncbi:hypothetical protein NQ317_015082 [Molorchus minor]|uniref:Uncharacterized protein n=1 Tax=Molorchus minor TaxID=1323400 RepID=A0ABQ9K4R5_9CUCU|nr:hypothetical protein NQ317_015082 [Molorchus minor]